MGEIHESFPSEGEGGQEDHSIHTESTHNETGYSSYRMGNDKADRKTGHPKEIFSYTDTYQPDQNNGLKGPVKLY